MAIPLQHRLLAIWLGQRYPCHNPTQLLPVFLIFSVLEFYRLTFFHANLELSSLYYSIKYIIFSTIVRAFVFFIVAREIINFQELFAYEVGTEDNVLSLQWINPPKSSCYYSRLLLVECL
jgi:hypothetical protein